MMFVTRAKRRLSFLAAPILSVPLTFPLTAILDMLFLALTKQRPAKVQACY